MIKVRVKVDGLTRDKDVKMVVDAGVDAVGFITGFPESPRNLSSDRVKEFLMSIPPFISTVVAVKVEDVKSLIESLDDRLPTSLQLYSSSDHKILVKGVSLIKVVHAIPVTAFNIAVESSKRFDAILIDSSIKGKSGGTGVVHDWDLSLKIRDSVYPTPLILAGGLNPENVADAVMKVKPYGVDVSSGVEKAPGVKDSSRVIEFVRRAKSVDIGSH